MRFFEVTHTKNWIETQLDYVSAENHRKVADTLNLKSKRVLNDRFNEIERTGEYYRITEEGKGGKAFIFEIINYSTIKKQTNE